MKKTLFIIASIASIFVVSCTKEQVTEIASEDVTAPVGVVYKDGKTYLTINAPEESKVNIVNRVDDTSEDSKRTIFWEEGDQLAWNGVPSDELGESYTPEEHSKSATFTWDGTLDRPAMLFTPADFYKNKEDLTIVTLPETGEMTGDDNIVKNNYPMCGTISESGEVTLNPLCAIVRLQIKGTVNKGSISKVEFSGRNEEQIWGDFKVDYTNATLTSQSTAAEFKKVTVTCSKEFSTTEAKFVNIIVPAGTYKKGFQVKIYDNSGKAMVQEKKSETTLTADKIVSFPVLNYFANEFVINSAEELVQFAQDYNNKLFAESSNVNPNVKLGQNIVFDKKTSAQFNETGGIGTKYGGDNYFNGVFNGNNKTISGLDATTPLFGGTGNYGVVKDLTLDENCTFTFTHDNSAEGMFSSIVGYHKGLLDNVKVAADVSLADKTDVTNMTSLGGLVGYANGGVIQNGSEYSGLISTPDGFKSTNKLIIGGLAGRIKTSSSKITGSYFKGAISNAAQITSSDKANPYLIIGGVVGFVDGGASVSSSNSTADHADEASAYSGSNGKIVNKTTVAYNSAVGGIVGELNNGTVSSCTNAATIACSIFKIGSDGSRFMKSGGIVGKVNENGTVTGCTNNGKVEHHSNPKFQDLGGIAGYNAGTISNCTNSAEVAQMTSGQSTKAGRYVYLGGVIGENIADNKVSDVHNTAKLEISSMEDGESSSECIGGVIGYNKGIVVGGASKDITNSGEVYHSPTFTKQFEGYNLGGIVGLTEAAVKNAKNTGRTYFRWNGTSTLGASKVYLGGIAGKASGALSTIENCENVVDKGVSNSAQVYLNLPANRSHRGNYIGGIVGLTDAINPVKDCTNGGEVCTVVNYSTVPVTDIKMGGIIGKMTGSGTVDNADNSGGVHINFIACTESTDSHSGNYLGGIVGYVINESAVTVTGCDNSGNVDVSNDKGFIHDLIVSGVVGRMDAPGTISNCKNNGGAINMAITKAAVAMNDLYVGGILGKTEQDITITGCSNTGAISGGNESSPKGNSFYIGGIAAYMKGACKILNCSNTGSTVSTHAGNNDNIGSTSLTGGIAGFVEGTSENPIEIGGTTGCTINTSTELSALRGWIAGVAAYAKYVQISKCTVKSNVGGGCAARGAGGIVGKAEYCSISSSYYNGDQIKSNQIQTSTGEGGIVGNLANSTIDGCYCYATKFYNNNSNPFGCIVGISGSNNTIQNCHYRSVVEGPSAGKAATAQVAGSGSFDGDGNVADL